jgi:hypothetical protein
VRCLSTRLEGIVEVFLGYLVFVRVPVVREFDTDLRRSEERIDVPRCQFQHAGEFVLGRLELFRLQQRGSKVASQLQIPLA